MRHYAFVSIILCSLLFLMCGGKATVKLGECPLTVTVKADDVEFDGFANVFIDGKFIGSTDPRTKTLRINLKKGEYTLVVVAEGYKPWRSKILLLGDGYKQTALARLKKE